MQITPYRFAEASFRLYEPSIAEIVARYPSPVTFDPSKLNRTPVTFAARLRDAITGLMMHNYPTHIDIPRLRKIRADFVIRHTRNGEVMACPRDYKPMAQVTVVSASTNPFDGMKEVQWYDDPPLLRMLAQLAHDRLLAGPVIVADVPEDLRSELESQFDIAFDQREDGKFVLL